MKTDCSAHIKVTAIRGIQKLVIKEINTDHNHVISKEVFENYTQNRALRKADEQTIHVPKNLIDAKANPRLMLKFVQEKTECVEDIKAIYNFKINLRLQG